MRTISKEMNRNTSFAIAGSASRVQELCYHAKVPLNIRTVTSADLGLLQLLRNHYNGFPRLRRKERQKLHWGMRDGRGWRLQSFNVIPRLVIRSALPFRPLNLHGLSWTCCGVAFLSRLESTLTNNLARRTEFPILQDTLIIIIAKDYHNPIRPIKPPPPVFANWSSLATSHLGQSAATCS